MPAATPLSMLFVMDPPARVHPEKDTTFAFMLEAQSRGHRVAFTRKEWLWSQDGRLWAHWRDARLARTTAPDHLILGEAHDDPVDAHQVVFIRPDPPFDIEYVKLTWLLDTVDRSRTLVMNEPAGIRAASEKLYTLRFPQLTPRTLITRDRDRLEAFLAELGGTMVVKPVDLMGGYGVFVIRADDGNKGALLEMSTREGRDLIVAQEYLPAAREGDKRIILLDGAPIGAVLRVPPPGENRGNIHVGARVERTTLTEADLHICETLAPALRADGIYFAGLDVIGGKLTEVNVTSPTGIQEIDRLDGVNLEAKVIDWVEGRAPRG